VSSFGSPSQPAAPAKTLAPIAAAGRLVSLDVFRGLTIAGMILVNDPGSWSSIYWPLDHAEWNGWTPTDLIFPFFLFIVGVSMTLSFAKRIERGATRGSLAKHVVLRSLGIFVIGLLLNGFPKYHLATIRIPGVLQRIAVCYLCAGLIYLATGLEKGWKWQAGIAAVLLIGYWAAMTFIPVPGYGAGHLDPESNLGAWLDRLVMSGHLWSQSKTWDPEGIMSTFPAIVTPLLGALFGNWLRRQQVSTRTALRVAAAGIVILTLGYALHPLFPINKKLWTSTFVIFTAGFAMVLLALCYWLVDVKKLRRWATPFLVFGTNALAIFVFADVLAILSTRFHHLRADGRLVTWHSFIYNKFFVPYANPYNASLLFAIFFVLVCLAAAWPLYHKRIFIKL
jgi:predicted acyltransferase